MERKNWIRLNFKHANLSLILSDLPQECAELFQQTVQHLAVYALSSHLLLRDCNSNWLSDCLLHGVTIGFWPCSSLFDKSSISFLDDASEPTQTSANLYGFKKKKKKVYNKIYRMYISLSIKTGF